MSAAGVTWRAAAALAEPGLRVLLRRRLRSGKEIAGRLHERRGFGGARPPGRLLWVHAASVGESNAVLPVLETLAAWHPKLSVLLTTATATSARLIERRLATGELPPVRHRMVPLDVPRWVARFLDGWRPDAACFVESELWPNTLAALSRRRVPAALLNARISERSFRGWSRLPGFARETLAAFTVVWARSDEDAGRLRRLGRAVERVGDLKDAAPPPEGDPVELERLGRLLAGRPRWLAASTHPGEEATVAAAHRQAAGLLDGLLTIVAPRHPERGAEIAALLGGAPRRSLGEGPPVGGGFWICDTVGEMGLLLRLAPAVFVGRSLSAAASGGQNPLEAARLGCTVATGPHTGNFAEAVRALDQAGVLTVVSDAGSLGAWICRHAGGAHRPPLPSSPALIGEAAAMLAALAVR